jgi:hypothetical protein
MSSAGGIMRRTFSAGLLALAAACGAAAVRPASETTSPQQAGQGGAMTFDDDLAFLTKHGNVVLLQDQAGKAQVIVAPDYQGRVMTSTAGGASGPSFCLINRS